jgi:hypothetical protein
MPYYQGDRVDFWMSVTLAIAGAGDAAPVNLPLFRSGSRKLLRPILPLQQAVIVGVQD